MTCQLIMIDANIFVEDDRESIGESDSHANVGDATNHIVVRKFLSRTCW